jgi:hypothetical protein
MTNISIAPSVLGRTTTKQSRMCSYDKQLLTQPVGSEYTPSAPHPTHERYAGGIIEPYLVTSRAQGPSRATRWLMESKRPSESFANRSKLPISICFGECRAPGPYAGARPCPCQWFNGHVSLGNSGIGMRQCDLSYLPHKIWRWTEVNTIDTTQPTTRL